MENKCHRCNRPFDDGTGVLVGVWAMKFMGSKRYMLKNGLGDLLAKEAGDSSRFVDLFCGGGSVTWFAATTLGMRVLANDLQEFARVLADAVVGRTSQLSVRDIERKWLSRVTRSRGRTNAWREAVALDSAILPIEKWSQRARELCSGATTVRQPISRAYGGHYFSPTQALSFDAMLRMLPEDREMKSVCLAATIMTASYCAAAPGHTAQPFKPNATAGKFLLEAWNRNPLDYAHVAVSRMCGMYARKRGAAYRSNANDVARSLESGDLVFIDPPYSSVQYSRFYHVLETVARGYCGRVVGVGRYPPREERPTSAYSRPGSSLTSTRELLEMLAQNKCKVVLTFPSGQCSNGLSGSMLEDEARALFHVKRHEIESKFSTLGGNTRNRMARKRTKESILVMSG